MRATFLLLTILLTACTALTPEASPAPTAAAGPSATPAPTETPVPTPTKVDVRANIPAGVEQAIGEQAFQGLVESIGENGGIRAMDYESGRETDFIINPETVSVSETADFHFKQVVTAQAEGKYTRRTKCQKQRFPSCYFVSFVVKNSGFGLNVTLSNYLRPCDE